MAGPAILKIDIIADATKALAALRKTGDQSDTTGTRLGALGKVAAGALTTTAIVAFGKASLSAAEESAQATARLDQVFRSMGDATGEAAAQAEKYASALSLKIGVDDEAIMAAQAQLATFRAVSDETARAAGIFDRATNAAADLAAAGFGSLDSNSIALGKALQDPTKGITALARSGVTFTAQQKEQIKAMQASGDLLGAQKVVLKAVESQVKGTAAATATSSQKMAVAYGEVQESVGNALLPTFQKLAPVLVTISGFIQENISWILPLVAAFALWTAATSVATTVQTAFGVSLGISVGWIALIVVAIAALVAGIIWAYNNVGWFRDLVDAAWRVIKAAFDAIKKAAEVAFNWIADNWKLILTILTGPVGAAVALIVTYWDQIKAAVMAVYNWIRDNWRLLLTILTGPIGAAVAVITAHWDTIKNAATDLYNWVRDKFQALADFISGLVSGIVHTADRIANAIKGPINTVLRAWNALEFKVPEVKVGPVTFGGQTIGLPDIPLLEHGGRVVRTGFAIVHAGETFSGVGNTLGGTTILNVHVTTTGLGADAPQIQRAVANALRGYTTRNGPLDIPVRSA